MASHWYAVYTYPRHEKKVLQSLQCQGFDSFLPTYKELHRWRNGIKKEVDLPLFPGYLFASFPLQEKVRVLDTPSVASLVGAGGEPTPLEINEVETIRYAIPKLGAEPHPFLKTGNRVRVRSGPLSGLEGVLVRKKETWRFVLCMDLIVQAVSVELDCADLEPMAIPAWPTSKVV